MCTILAHDNGPGRNTQDPRPLTILGLDKPDYSTGQLDDKKWWLRQRPLPQWLGDGTLQWLVSELQCKEWYDMGTT